MLGGKPAAGPALPDSEGLHGECGHWAIPTGGALTMDPCFCNYWQLLFSCQHYFSFSSSARLKGKRSNRLGIQR